jgi:hypothetical protein
MKIENTLLVQLAADALAKFRGSAVADKLPSLTAVELADVLRSAQSNYPTVAATLDVDTVAKSLEYAVKIGIDPVQAIEDHCISEQHSAEIEENSIS